MNLFYSPDISGDKTTLSPEESLHCVKVLRQKEQDQVFVADGKGRIYKAVITKAHPKNCELAIQEVYLENAKKEHYIHIAISPTKSADRIEWFVEKAVELGIDRISFLRCEHSERKNLNIDRIRKITINALKQSLNLYLPEVSDLENFNKFLPQQVQDTGNKYIAYVERENKHLMQVVEPKGRYLVLIGPEGDFSPSEIQMAKETGFTAIGLGESRLRTETAGIAACHILNLINVT